MDECDWPIAQHFGPGISQNFSIHLFFHYRAHGIWNFKSNFNFGSVAKKINSTSIFTTSVQPYSSGTNDVSLHLRNFDVLSGVVSYNSF